MKKVVILNCYSSNNSGDGLLVDLAVQSLKEKYGNISVTLVASDPVSFSGKYNATHNEFFNAPGAITFFNILVKLILFIFTGNYKASEYNKLKDADLIYSVGGGYLRFGSIKETIKTSVIHLSQMAWVKSNMKVKHCLMPQSIGPFRWMPVNLLKKFISHCEMIQLRDDRSFSDLSSVGLSVCRSEDLAVGQLKNGLMNESYSHINNSSVCIVVLRDIRRGKQETQEFINKVRSAISQFDEVVFAVQSKVNGNDDSFFYKKHGIHNSVKLGDALKLYPEAVVLSVRLHGALESMIKKHKTMHLSYERKGFGAFEDLGLREFVMNVYSIDGSLLKIQMSRLKDMEQFEYFDKIKLAL